MKLSRLILLSLTLLFPPACTHNPVAKGPSGARLRVLGIAQDGGLPHAACRCERCEAARRDPARRHSICGLGLIVPGKEAGADDRVYLIEATPDLRDQLAMLRDVRRPPDGKVDRSPVDGVFITHAHIGHYLGLAFLGFESVHVRELPLWCSPRMAEFLRTNGPWSQLVSMKNVVLNPVAGGESVVLDSQLSLRPITVPHRDEFSDTVAYLVAGRKRRVLFIPDTEAWDRWAAPLEQLLDRESVDVLLVDGTFFSADELPGRAVSSIGHPLIRDTMDRLQARVDDGRTEVVFIHLNHSNPALDPDSEAAREIERRGFRVAREGDEFSLDG